MYYLNAFIVLFFINNIIFRGRRVRFQLRAGVYTYQNVEIVSFHCPGAIRYTYQAAVRARNTAFCLNILLDVFVII